MPYEVDETPKIARGPRTFEKFPWVTETTTTDHWRVFVKTDGPAHADDQRGQALDVKRPPTNDLIPGHVSPQSRKSLSTKGHITLKMLIGLPLVGCKTCPKSTKVCRSITSSLDDAPFKHCYIEQASTSTYIRGDLT